MLAADDPLLEVFREVFQNDSLELAEGATFEDVPGWDSVAHVNLINAVEERYGVKFSIGEIMSMDSVAAIRQVLATRTGRNN